MPKGSKIECSPLEEIRNNEEFSCNGFAMIGASINRPSNPLTKNLCFWLPQNIENNSSENEEICLRNSI